MTTAEATDRESRPQGRRRGAALQRAIFDAVIEQLSTVGYAKLTMEGVAVAANTGKAALYRRWDNRDALVRDALRELLPEPPEPPADVPLREGLLLLLAYFNGALFDSKGAAFQAVAAESGSDTAMLRDLFQTRVTEPCQERILALMREDAGVRGTTLGDEARQSALATVGPAMLMYHCVSGQDRSTEAQIASVVDTLLLPLARGSADQT